MNTKISTLGAAMVALEDESIQVCYAQADVYNANNYSTPGGTFLSSFAGGACVMVREISTTNRLSIQAMDDLLGVPFVILDDGFVRVVDLHGRRCIDCSGGSNFIRHGYEKNT